MQRLVSENESMIGVFNVLLHDSSGGALDNCYYNVMGLIVQTLDMPM